MAITWRNVNTGFNVAPAVQATNQAGQQVGSAIKGLQDILTQAQTVRQGNNATLSNNAVAEFENRLRSMTPEQIQQAQQSGELDAMRQQITQGTAAYVDPTKLGAQAVQSILQSRMADTKAAGEYQDYQLGRSERPIVDQAYEALTAGDLATARRLSEQLQTQQGIDLLMKVQEAEKRQQRKSAFTQAQQLVDGLGTRLNQDVGQVKQHKAEIAKKLGIPVTESGDVLLDQVKDPKLLETYATQIEQMDKLNMTQWENNARSQLSQLLAQYADDPAAQQMLQRLDQSLGRVGQLGTYDQNLEAKRSTEIDLAYGMDTNPFAQAAKVDPSQAKTTAGDLVAEWAKVNPEGFKSMDSDDRSEVIRTLGTAMSEGIQVGDQKVRMPADILRAFVISEADNWGPDDSIEEKLRDFATQGNLGKALEQYVTAQKEKKVFSSALRKQAGLVTPQDVDNSRQVRNLAQRLREEEAKRRKAAEDKQVKAVDTKRAQEILQGVLQSHGTPGTVNNNRFAGIPAINWDEIYRK